VCRWDATAGTDNRKPAGGTYRVMQAHCSIGLRRWRSEDHDQVSPSEQRSGAGAGRGVRIRSSSARRRRGTAAPFVYARSTAVAGSPPTSNVGILLIDEAPPGLPVAKPRGSTACRWTRGLTRKRIPSTFLTAAPVSAGGQTEQCEKRQRVGSCRNSKAGGDGAVAPRKSPPRAAHPQRRGCTRGAAVSSGWCVFPARTDVLGQLSVRDLRSPGTGSDRHRLGATESRLKPDPTGPTHRDRVGPRSSLGAGPTPVRPASDGRSSSRVDPADGNVLREVGVSAMGSAVREKTAGRGRGWGGRRSTGDQPLPDDDYRLFSSARHGRRDARRSRIT